MELVVENNMIVLNRPLLIHLSVICVSLHSQAIFMTISFKECSGFTTRVFKKPITGVCNID
jgi:hypothetical protein